MFVAQALFDFSPKVLQSSQQKSEEDEPLYNKSQKPQQQPQQQLDKGKRRRSEDHDKQLQKQGQDKFHRQQNSENKKEQDVHYLTFQKGEKLLVEQAFETGWWYGHVIKRSQQKGFFPSNYVKVGAKPPPPPPPKQNEEQSYQNEGEQEPQQEAEWLNKKLNDARQTQQQVITSDYYQGIKGFKYVKINENNKNILKGNYVKFDVNTGLARVPVKDQAPCSKAVRQMGYYFDYHQWNQERNKDPQAWRNKPDPAKKRKKKLRLVGMGKDA